MGLILHNCLLLCIMNKLEVFNMQLMVFLALYCPKLLAEHKQDSVSKLGVISTSLVQSCSSSYMGRVSALIFFLPSSIFMEYDGSPVQCPSVFIKLFALDNAEFLYCRTGFNCIV